MSAVLGAPPFPAELDVHVCRTRTAEAGVPEAGNNPAVQVAVARVVKPQLVRDEVDVIVRGRALYGASCYSRCGLGHSTGTSSVAGASKGLGICLPT